MATTVELNRSSKIESIALKWAFITALITGTFWLFYFIIFDIQRLPIIGRPSIGAGIVISEAIIVLIGFFTGYIYGQREIHNSGDTQKRLWLRGASLALAYTIIFTIFTGLLVYLLSISFKELTLDRYLSTFIIAVSGALVTYIVVNLSTTIETLNIVSAFAIFMVAGVFTSMATSINPLWWEINFSSLGATHSFSAKVFNATLILSAVLMICMSSHLFQDLKLLITGNKNLPQQKLIL